MRRLKSPHLFLKQVYKHSKPLFVLMIAFVMGQLYFNFKIGVLYYPAVYVSPFYLYGMYANAYHVNDEYTITEVEVNGNLLQGKDFTPQQWDKIIIPINYFNEIKASNRVYSTHIKPTLTKVGIETNDQNFLQSCTAGQFKSWYLPYLQNIIPAKIKTLQIRKRIYRYNGNVLQPNNAIAPLD